MNAKFGVNAAGLGSLYKKIDSKAAKAQAVNLKALAKSYYASTSQAHLAQANPTKLLAEIEAAWEFLQQRKGRAAKVQVSQVNSNSAIDSGGSTVIHLLVDDMPFLVDSVRQLLNQRGMVIQRINNAVLFVERDRKSKDAASAKKQVRRIAAEPGSGLHAEALISFRCNHLPDAELKQVTTEIKDSLKEVAVAVKDFPAICQRAIELREGMLARREKLPVSSEEVDESTNFISWLLDNHFTFLGYEEYQVGGSAKDRAITLQKSSLLGISKFKKGLKGTARLASLPKETGELIMRKQLCSFAKSGTRSKVHRPGYPDYVLIKEFDDNGNVAVEHRFLGLYTSSVYYRAVLEIPLVRKKVERVLAQSGFAVNGHSIKDLLQVINVLPRDELFQMSSQQLFNTAMQITQMQETRTTRLFIRKDAYSKFFSCLVYLPRESYNTRTRLLMQDFLKEKLQAQEVEFDTYFSESILARVHFILRVPDIQNVQFDSRDLEAELTELIKPWNDRFTERLDQLISDNSTREVFNSYASCFSESYKEAYNAADAVKDINHIIGVLQSEHFSFYLQNDPDDENAPLELKLFNFSQQLMLSDVAPILENMGLTVVSEHAYKLKPQADKVVWLHDFSLVARQTATAEGDSLNDLFESAFSALWGNQADDDSFNGLVLGAGLHWRDVVILRAYAAYMKQIQLGYSSQFISETLISNRNVTALIVQLFYARFDPAVGARNRDRTATGLHTRILTAIDKVKNLAEDSVLRNYLALIAATLRTNYFQPQEDGSFKDYISFKFLPELVANIPLPKPKFEIFVYSTQMEGVHLRGGKVARGGLRWSDRREDYRTEVLGLVKAQQVKNSVIVPVGAKGGFVVKQPPADNSRDAFLEQGISCYKMFIRGLLDITDNLIDNEIIPPSAVIRHDEDDPYLVVAADKGTATFSDIANGIAEDYGFWLQDGFASGGSNGYDHKKMGITAKGAWVSVQRHFREQGVDVQKQDIHVVGIGDMSGDVFGNGMLLSKHICLAAAFNHLHIFIDPNPDAAIGYKERKRLFNLSRSNWSDYEAKLISKGGGIFSRSLKTIPISAEMKARFHLKASSMAPDQLISALLRSPVDLIWNGGIGTYVKASHESHSEVGDKANDTLRVNANELRCKVIGEGGNLGLTQSARIEFGRNNGTSLTDFIDNSAGVDCSDHEVNIKILLNKLVINKQLQAKARNKLLVSMTGAVSTLVLSNNYHQVQAIGLAHVDTIKRAKEYAGLISFLEKNAGLDRALEYLPSHDELEERIAKNQGLTRPELSVMTSYIKMHLKSELVDAPYINDDYLLPYLISAFPAQLNDRYNSEIKAHRLRDEIVATQLANSLVNRLGPSFVYRMAESTGASSCEIVRAAVIAKDIYAIDIMWDQIEALDFKVEAQVQDKMMAEVMRLMRRATRWLLRNRRRDLEFKESREYFAKSIKDIRCLLPDRLPESLKVEWQKKYNDYVAAGVPAQLANEIALAEHLYPIMAMIEVGRSHKVKAATIVDIYYGIGDKLDLNWLSQHIKSINVANYWQALARESFQEDLEWQQRALTDNIVCFMADGRNVKTTIDNWCNLNADLIERSHNMLAQLQREGQFEYPMFSVALRELLNLAQSTTGSH